MKLRQGLWLIAAVVLALVACRGKDEGRLAGSATYREKMSLPAGALFEADLVELGQTEAERRVVAQATVDKPGPVPIAFEIRYKKSALDPARPHVLDARIRLGQRVLLETRTPVPVLMGNDPKIVELLLTRAGPGGDVAGLEAEVASIDAKAPTLRRVEGSFREGDIAGSFVGYLDGDTPVLILEGRDLGAGASSSLGYHFRDGVLVRYAEDTMRRASPNEDLDRGVSVSLKLYFDGNRYVGGTKLVDGVAEEPDEGEISEATKTAGLAVSRVAGKLAKSPGSRNATVMACEDGSVFRTVPDTAGDSLRLERLGRDPLVLPHQPSASGALFGDGGRSLFTKGDTAMWTQGDMPTVGCKRAPAETPLRLAPGHFPAADLTARPAGAWERNLLTLMPALNACLAHAKLDVPRVTEAAPVSGGVVSVSLMSADGGRVTCVVSADGSKITSSVTSASRAGEAPDQKSALFTPATSAYPATACYTHERVVKPDGTFLGWLSQSRC